MTREYLAERVNELLIERATSQTKIVLHEKAMDLIDLYVESREIPPPPLKWSAPDLEHPSSGRQATVFKYVFRVLPSTFTGKAFFGQELKYIASVDHGEVGRYDTEEEAIKASEAKWKEIWEKELSHRML